MALHFTYPSGTNWLLIVWTYNRPLAENQQAAVFTWFTCPSDIPLTLPQANFEISLAVSGYPGIFNYFCPDGASMGYNYYMQSRGNKYSNTKHTGTVISISNNILPSGGSICYTKRGAPGGGSILGRMNIPYVSMLAVGNDGRWNFAARSLIAQFKTNFIAGFNIGGWGHFTPAVYSRKTDTLTAIQQITHVHYPRVVRRRRIRPHKTGHFVTAPLNWGTPGHW
jgi:hypothetical protein